MGVGRAPTLAPLRHVHNPQPLTFGLADLTHSSGRMSEDLSFPIGRFTAPATYTPASRAAAMAVLEATPRQLRKAVAGLSDEQLDTPYRPGGWTVRQVVHHVPDSHMHALVRWKLALTEEAPPAKAYNEQAWALLEDARSTPIETSLRLVEGLHDRWLRVIRAMEAPQFARTYVHSESGVKTLDYMLALYEWHGPHHVAHITRLRERMGW